MVVISRSWSWFRDHGRGFEIMVMISGSWSWFPNHDHDLRIMLVIRRKNIFSYLTRWFCGAKPPFCTSTLIFELATLPSSIVVPV
jgi:hypothetical protein